MTTLTALPPIGKTVIVKKNTNDHNYKIGEKYIVRKYTSSTTFEATHPTTGWCGNNLKYSDCELYFGSKEDFLKKIDVLNRKAADIQIEVDRIQSIMEWMDATGTDKYDENEHKVWQTLTTFENGAMSKMEKVKAIAALLN